MLRHFKPKKVVEIGSGFSSAVMLDTNEEFPDTAANLTFIEPNPERLLGLLREEYKRTSSVTRDYMQNVDLSLFASLGKNDILFMDSSHIVKVGSDVN